MDTLTLLQQELLNNKIACRFGEPLSAHTTFKIGGPASVFCLPRNAEELRLCLALCHTRHAPYYLLGRGSNTLFADSGFSGVVIDLTYGLRELWQEGTDLVAEAGVSLTALCQRALELDLTGLEFAYGIPGSVGGAAYMNAGAYGGELKDVVVEATYLDENCSVCTAPVQTLGLGYRKSLFMERNWCILQVRFHLTKGDHASIQSRMEELMARRKEKQPLEYPSAGSTFKRPEGAFAGALIEQCGLRGYRVGDAAISEKHCGFVVNLGQASCSDVIRLTEQVRDRVQAQTGYVLEREIRVVGEKR